MPTFPKDRLVQAILDKYAAVLGPRDVESVKKTLYTLDVEDLAHLLESGRFPLKPGSGSPASCSSSPIGSGSPSSGSSSPIGGGSHWSGRSSPFTSGSPSRSGCFIATAAYGSAFERHVGVLERLRDERLVKHRAGRALVSLYYRCSPRLASYIRKHDRLRAIVRLALRPIVELYLRSAE